jgi:signal transduction histidine kinase
MGVGAGKMTDANSSPLTHGRAPGDANAVATSLWQRLRARLVGPLRLHVGDFLNRFIEMFRIQAPAPEQILQRIETMERHIILPIKAAGIAILLQPHYFSSWIGDAARDLDISDAATRAFFGTYIFLNIVFAVMLLCLRRLPPVVREWSVFVMSLVDGVFIGILTLVTGGYNSSLYWFFLGLIARSAVSVPRAARQLLLNLTVSACYVMAGVFATLIAKHLTPTEQAVDELIAVGHPAEPLSLRLILLLLMTFGCYAVQVLLERQRQAAEEAREFAVREVQLRSAGRLAAEFAHQIKNPLAIINNAAYSLQRGLGTEQTAAAEQVHMIQEEVGRADRIITEVMGYAQLSEGHVEKLNAIEQLNEAIERVFPSAAAYPIRVHKEFGHGFPPLVMLRRHASEIFMNVLQNARDALETRGGNVFVTAQTFGEHTIEVSIADDGPGIPPDKLGRIFEAYYTTKARGTGLGLATVKHNIELYGGTVRVESELGKGARFVLVFPAKTLMKLAKTG